MRIIAMSTVISTLLCHGYACDSGLRFRWPSASSNGETRSMSISDQGCDEALFSEEKGFSVKRGEAIQ